MILAKNETYSLHKLEPDTYVHETYVLVEKKFKFVDYEYITTLFTVPSDKMERLEKLVRSIKNGANGSDIELYPLYFICGFSGYEKCPANERATALAELAAESEKT